MTRGQARLVFSVSLLFAVAFQPVRASAVGCCRCTSCSPPRPPVFCIDTAGDSGDCEEVCLPDCPGTRTFDEAATCGVGEFADCLGGLAPSVPAPALGWSGIALAAAGLFAVGLARRRRWMGGAA